MGNVFSTNDIRGRVGESLTTEYIWNLGKALADWLPPQGDIIIFKAANANGSVIHALSEGILLQGKDIVDGGQGDQQSVTTTVGERQAAGGILVAHDDLQNIEIITLFDDRGVIINMDNGLSEIEQLIDAGNFLPAPEKGSITSL